MLNERIRNLRKQNNLTQEQLAEKMNVSRQAITKWESGAGQPDIGNLKTLAQVFDISYDELLCDGEIVERDNVSRTEFDVFGENNFEIHWDCVKALDITTGDFEKIAVEIRTDLPDKAYHLAKVHLENGRGKDIAVIRIRQDKKYQCSDSGKPLSKQEAKKHLTVNVMLPQSVADHIELQGDVEALSVHDIIQPKHIEFDGKVHIVAIRSAKGHFELTSGENMEITYDGSMEQLDVNQLGAISNLYLTKDARVNVYQKGRSCAIIFDGYENVSDAENQVELNGRKTELTVRRK